MQLKNRYLSPIDRYEKALQELPPGHDDIKKAKQSIDSEYKSARLLEEYWIKRISKKRFEKINKTLSSTNIHFFIHEICDEIGVKRPKDIICDYKLLSRFTGAHYETATKTIVLGNVPNAKTAIHELAHHVVSIERIQGIKLPEHLSFLEEKEKILSMFHGKSFLWAEDLIFQIVEQNVKT